MSVKVEKTENKNEVKLEFTVEAEKFNTAIKNVFNKNAKYFNIPGFRKGKAPMNIVEKFYGEEIFFEDAFNEILPDVYNEAVKNEKIDVVSHPDIHIDQIGKGKDLIFTAVVQTKPEVKLGKYKGITLEKTVYKVTSEAVDNELKRMAERNSRIVTVSDRPAQMGDITVIDFEGSVDGNKFEGGTSKNHELELGSNTFIPGFEEQVVGMKIDEEKDINVKFPKDYFSKDLAEKDAIFKVVLHEIKKKEVPEIDDEFAKDVSEFDTIKELREDTEKKLQEEQDNRAKNELDESAIKAVTESSEVEVPSGMVEVELDGMIENMSRNLSYQGISIEQYFKMIGKTEADYRESSRETAKNACKTRLVLEAVYKDSKQEVTDKEIEDKLTELATMYGRKAEELKENEELITRIKESLESEKSVKFIVDNAKIVEVDEKDEKKPEKKEKTSTKKESSKKEEKNDVKEEKKSDKKVSDKSEEKKTTKKASK